MPRLKPIGLRCQISRGGFSGERVVLIPRPHGEPYLVLAPRHYCWDLRQQPVEPDEPPEGEKLDGIVAAQQVGQDAGGNVFVSVPDGEVFAVSPDIVTERPRSGSELAPNVPV